MEFKIGDIVSHKSRFTDFFIIIEDYKNGQYLVEDHNDYFGPKKQYVFVGKYLLTKSDRRDHLINNILNFPFEKK
jgi:hypothetical protein